MGWPAPLTHAHHVAIASAKDKDINDALGRIQILVCHFCKHMPVSTSDIIELWYQWHAGAMKSYVVVDFRSADTFGYEYSIRAVGDTETIKKTVGEDLDIPPTASEEKVTEGRDGEKLYVMRSQPHSRYVSIYWTPGRKPKLNYYRSEREYIRNTRDIDNGPSPGAVVVFGVSEGLEVLRSVW